MPKQNVDIVKLWALRASVYSGALYKDTGYSTATIPDKDKTNYYLNISEAKGDWYADIGLDFRNNTDHTRLPLSREMPWTTKNYKIKNAAIRIAIDTIKTTEKQNIIRTSIILTNTDKLAALLDMNDVERDILGVVYCTNINPIIREVFSSSQTWQPAVSGALPNLHIVSLLSKTLGHSEAKVSKALQPNQILSKTKLISPKRFDDQSVWNHSLFDPLPHEFVTAFSSPGISTTKLKRFFFRKIRTTNTIKPSDVYHLEDEYSLLVKYLKNTTKTKKKGSNVLLYGAPGTGKTVLAQLVAKEAGLSIIAPTDDNDNRNSNRFEKAQTTQYLLKQAKEQYVMLLDEAEDIFNRTEWYGAKADSGMFLSKELVNRSLETNPIPVIWICNEAYLADPAFRRRFDLVIEIPIPPVRVRENIFRKYCRGLGVSKRWIDGMAKNHSISPADIESSARVAKLTKVTPGEEAEKTVALILKEKTKVRGARITVPKKKVTDGNIPYDLNYANTSISLPRLINGLSVRNEGRLCLYGPPGTGKSEFVRQFANTVGKELTVRRASDILGKYVGETEENIAAMFEEAAKLDTVLVLDEADSFLRDRRMAKQSWEVTQVNELLVQMENFNGIFACCTNLMDNIDQATFRRFDFKIQFNSLDSNQATELFCSIVGKTNEDEQAQVKKALAKMPGLTPGDFVAIVRKFYILGESPTVRTLLDSLAEEYEFKDEQKTTRIVGFR